jgi:hypothetical protein
MVPKLLGITRDAILRLDFETKVNVLTYYL